MDAPTTNAFPTIVTDFGYSPLQPAIWKADAASGLVCRDLSLRGASRQAFDGVHLRTGGHARQATLVPARTRFAFVFVLAGRVSLIDASGRATQLGALDSATRYGTAGATDLALSHDAEILLVTSREAGEVHLGDDGAGTWSVSRESEEAYVLGLGGPRSFFRYRNLGVDDATRRRIHIHIVRATEPPAPGGTGHHNHSMGQLFYVLRGWADLVLQDQPSVRMNAGDAMCLAARMTHNVPDFAEDYLVLEMCLPADYDTISQTPGDEAAAE